MRLDDHWSNHGEAASLVLNGGGVGSPVKFLLVYLISYVLNHEDQQPRISRSREATHPTELLFRVNLVRK